MSMGSKPSLKEEIYFGGEGVQEPYVDPALRAQRDAQEAAERAQRDSLKALDRGISNMEQRYGRRGIKPLDYCRGDDGFGRNPLGR